MSVGSRSRRSWLLVGLALAGLGCRSPRRESTTTAPSATTPATATATKASDRDVDASAELALLERPDAGASPPEAPPLGWQTVARSPQPYRLHRLDAALLVVSGGKIWEATLSGLESRSRVLEATGAAATVAWVQAVHGHWPSNAWAVAFERPPPAPGRDRVFVGRYIRWEKDHWVVSDSDDTPGARVPWTDGRILVGESHWVGGEGALPVFASAGDEACSIRLAPIDATAVAGEHVFALGLGAARGDGCRLKDRGSWVEHFAPGQAHGQLDPLPPVVDEVGPRARVIDARTPDDVVVAGFVEINRERVETLYPYLAHYDGKRWSILPAPPTRAFPAGIARTKDGTLFLATSTWKYARPEEVTFESSSDLWRKPPAGAWERVVLPRVFDVGVDPGGAVWVSAATSEAAFVLLRSAPR